MARSRRTSSQPGPQLFPGNQPVSTRVMLQGSPQVHLEVARNKPRVVVSDGPLEVIIGLPNAAAVKVMMKQVALLPVQELNRKEDVL